jgi:transmembrane sensor
MTTEPAASESDNALEQACAWLAKLHSGQFSAAQEQQLQAWRQARAVNEEAWRQAESLWLGLENLPNRSKPIPGAQPLLQEQRNDKKPRLPKLAAALAIACSIVLALTLNYIFPPALWQADYRTSKGHQQTIALSDGSMMTLNSASAASIHFNNYERRIELLQGEAFFSVAKAQLPFLVGAGGNEVKAVGTEFAVKLQAQVTQVELVEGKVQIQDARHQESKQLIAGDRAQINDGLISVQHLATPQNLALWREGLLLLDSLPLAEAIEQINRYRPGRVILLNSTLARQRVSGLIRLDALDQAVEALKAAVPQLQSHQLTPYFVVLS